MVSKLNAKCHWKLEAELQTNAFFGVSFCANKQKNPHCLITVRFKINSPAVIQAPAFYTSTLIILSLLPAGKCFSYRPPPAALTPVCHSDSTAMAAIAELLLHAQVADGLRDSIHCLQLPSYFSWLIILHFLCWQQLMKAVFPMQIIPLA